MYQLGQPIIGQTESKVVIRTNADGTITSIPFDPNNTDFAEYEKWVAAGNTPTPASA